MSLQQFDNEDSLRAQRMTADESRAVIALWQQERVEQTGLTDKPAVPDVAEGLNIPIEEVQRLLAAIRIQRVEEERALAQEQELSEIRLAEAERKLAEEERKVAEIRRQRAELERSMTAFHRQHTELSALETIVAQRQPLAEQLREEPHQETYRKQPLLAKVPKVLPAAKAVQVRENKKSFAIQWPLPVLIISILTIIWLIVVIYHQNTAGLH